MKSNKIFRYLCWSKLTLETPYYHIFWRHLWSITEQTRWEMGERWEIGELEKAVETLACGSCSHSIFRSLKLSLVFLYLERNTVHVFYFLMIAIYSLIFMLPCWYLLLLLLLFNSICCGKCLFYSFITPLGLIGYPSNGLYLINIRIFVIG